MAISSGDATSGGVDGLISTAMGTGDEAATSSMGPSRTVSIPSSEGDCGREWSASWLLTEAADAEVEVDLLPLPDTGDKLDEKPIETDADS